MNSNLVKARVCHAAQEEYRLRLGEGEAANREANQGPDSRENSALSLRESAIANSSEITGEPSGRLRAFGELPAVGDWVQARVVGDFALIEEVLPRRTAFMRRAAGRGAKPQVLAANVDVAFLVSGLDGDYNPRRLERYLVLARESGAAPVVVLNKADLCGESAARRAEVEALAPGCPVVVVCAHAEVDALWEHLPSGSTAVLLGSSGAGKSTIANALLGRDEQRTAAVRATDSRGRHTTTQRMLFPLDNGAALIDTPGLRELQLWADAGAVEAAFGEIAALSADCRFANCEHESEPGCAVQEALSRGELDTGRWQSYQKLRAEVRHLETEADPSLQRAQKKKWKAIHKAIRHHPKYRR